MATKSGKDGRVEIGPTAVASITAWQLTIQASSLAYTSSATGGAVARLPGAKDARGSIVFQLDFTSPITESLEEGTLVTLKLYLDRTRFYTVPAVIDAIEFEPIDVVMGDPIGGKIIFSGAGPITSPVFA